MINGRCPRLIMIGLPSLFISQDGVAIESVGLDFLRSESSQNNVTGNVDNYLHEAALAFTPPSSTFYDPDQDNSPLKSLGVHEHWNNAEDKQYSRNLGIGEGIELVYLHEVATKTPVHEQNQEIKVFPNPASQVVHIEFENHFRDNVKVFIRDLNGKHAIHTLAIKIRFFLENPLLLGN